MGFKAFGFSIDAHSEQIIRSMAAVATSEPIDVIDLGTFSADFTNEDMIFIFGEKARREIGDKPAGLRLSFPEVHKLDATFGEEEERKLAYDQLLKLKRLLASNDQKETEAAESELGTSNSCTITEEVLPELSSYDVLRYMKAALRNQGTKEWLGSTKNGKLVRLTLEKEEGKADINMTFAELYLLRLAMETLQVKELEIVYKPGVNQQGGSYGSRSSNDQ
jgi:hypothetical protein